jgi:hypothetical protein
MTAKTKKKPPFVSGFCTPNNPRTKDYDPHQRCRGCDCTATDCHQTSGAAADSGALVSDRPADEVMRGGTNREPGGEPSLSAAPESLHGFHDDIEEQEYHAHATSLSVSGAKVLLKAPALFQWQRTHPVHKDVWDFGSAAHALVLGKGMESIYVAPYDDWIKRNGPEGGVKYTTDEKKIGQADGLSVILPKDWLIVCDMADALSQNTLAMELLSEGEAEVSAFALDEPTGVLRRGRFDWLAPTILSDYKTAASANPDGFDRTAFNLGYHMQAAWYLDLASDLDHPAQAFAFIVQEKDPPYLVSVCELDRDALALGRERNRQALEVFRDCSASGIWPGYQADGTFSTISLPRYAFYDRSAS